VVCRPLDDLTSADAARVGGKAWNCARLKQHGLPVPDGLAVFADATDADLGALQTHGWFDRLLPDERVAVRSSGLEEDSAAESFAGIHETQLNVARGDILTAVRACRASADSDRARAYRQARGMPAGAAGVGVLIQRMVPATVSGVAFTIDPVSASADEMVINAAPGLGVAVVDGTVDPDEIRIRKSDGVPTLPPNASLNAAQVGQLSALLKTIEAFYGAPQDIEWCFDGCRFWIVQSRPITTRADPSRDIEWTRANLAEVLPELTSPQALHAIEDMLNIAERRYMGGFLAPYHELGPIVGSFYGRLYFNLTQFRHLCFLTRTPLAAALRSLGHSGQISADDEKVPNPPLFTLLARAPDFIRILSRHLRAKTLLRRHDATIDTFIRELRSVDPATLSDERLWASITEWQRRGPETIEIVLLFGGVLFHERQLKKICESVNFPYERLIYSHLAAGQRSVSGQQAFDLVALTHIARTEPRTLEWLSRSDGSLASMRASLAGTRFLREFERFLDNYGHRGLYESDWALPRYREDPSPLIQAIRLHLADSDELSTARPDTDEEAATIKAEFERAMPTVKRWLLLPRARQLLTTIKNFYVWREQSRSDMIRVAAELRQWHLVLADRFVERGWIERRDDYFFLLLDEIDAAIDVRGSTRSPRASLRDIVTRRRRELEQYRHLELPLLMHESELPELIAQARSSRHAPLVDNGSEMRGTPVSRGQVEATVVVIADPGDFGSMQRGAILVARATDPSWTPLFTLASGVIVEVGGILSHASTIAREYGLPALANVKQATKRLKTGDRILLNATEGWARRC
jgi:phosphohistidine swiveling domain-containing protein